MKIPQNTNGIMKMTLHHFDQLEGQTKPNTKYFIYANAVKSVNDISMSASDPKKQADPLKWLFEREDSFQCQHEFTFKIQSLLDTEIMIRVTKKGFMIGKNEKPVVNFSISLKDAVELMRGPTPIYIMIDASNEFSS